MTSEKRLNQVEPFIAELSAQLDRVTTQNKQLITISLQYGDDIQFLLHEVGNLKLGQEKIEQRLDTVEQGLIGVTNGVGGLATGLNGLSTKFDGLSTKVDLIVELLQTANGRSSK